MEKCGEAARTRWFSFEWGRLIAGFPEKAIALFSSRRAQIIKTTFALVGRHEKGRGHAPGQPVLASMGRFANAVKRRAKGPALDFTARLRGWEQASRVAERDLARTIWRATPHASAPTGTRSDTDAELARKAGWAASRGELTHAQERVVMAAGLARAPSEDVPILHGEQAAAPIDADFGQPQTQLHAGAAGG